MQYHNQFPMTATGWYTCTLTTDDAGKLRALFGDDVLADIWRTL